MEVGIMPSNEIKVSYQLNINITISEVNIAIEDLMSMETFVLKPSWITEMSLLSRLTKVTNYSRFKYETYLNLQTF